MKQLGLTRNTFYNLSKRYELIYLSFDCCHDIIDMFILSVSVVVTDRNMGCAFNNKKLNTEKGRAAKKKGFFKKWADRPTKQEIQELKSYYNRLTALPTVQAISG